jgi:hypothetical protein
LTAILKTYNLNNDLHTIEFIYFSVLGLVVRNILGILIHTLIEIKFVFKYILEE